MLAQETSGKHINAYVLGNMAYTDIVSSCSSRQECALFQESYFTGDVLCLAERRSHDDCEQMSKDVNVLVYCVMFSYGTSRRSDATIYCNKEGVTGGCERIKCLYIYI